MKQALSDSNDDSIKEKLDALKNAASKAGESLYKNSANANAKEAPKEDVQDAEFKEK